jgi:hypothetical protein
MGLLAIPLGTHGIVIPCVPRGISSIVPMHQSQNTASSGNLDSGLASQWRVSPLGAGWLYFKSV